MEPQKTIFLSYCHKDTEHADIIDKDLQVHMHIQLDSDLHYKDSIPEYMKKIRLADHAILLLSEDFLLSANCMFEMTELLKEVDFGEKVLPVMVQSLSIFKPEGRAKLIKYWQTEEKKRKKEVKGIEAVNLGSLPEDLKKAQEISASVGAFISAIANMKLITLKELKSTGYKELLDAIGIDKDAFIAILLEIAAIEDEEERDNAIDSFVFENPNNYAGYFVKSDFESEKNKYKRNLFYLNKSMQIEPNDAALWNNMGVSLNKLGRFEESLVAYNRSSRLDPSYTLPLTNKAKLLVILERHDEALASLDQSIAIDSFNADSWYGKGLILGNLDQNKDALAAFERALEINADYVEAWQNKGIVLKRLGREEQAKQAFEKARELKPELFEEKDEEE